MVKVVANGYKISHKKYVIEIDTEDLMTRIFIKQQSVREPLKYLRSIEDQKHPIDCLFKAMDFIYVHNKGNYRTM